MTKQRATIQQAVIITKTLGQALYDLTDGKECSQSWKDLSDEDRDHYEDAAEEFHEITAHLWPEDARGEVEALAKVLPHINGETDDIAGFLAEVRGAVVAMANREQAVLDALGLRFGEDAVAKIREMKNSLDVFRDGLYTNMSR